ncbi:hypothetical protein NHQ30_000198 [Ciborinia camelliae]|nr:hypothetical protein NHQ30_000198 [Ciborinia camelliae]
MEQNPAEVVPESKERGDIPVIESIDSNFAETEEASNFLQGWPLHFLMMSTAFLTGAPLTIGIIQIPLRFQFINELSPLNASIRMLPYVTLFPIGSIVVAALAGKVKVPPVYLVLGSSVFQCVGFGLLSTSPGSKTVHASQYGYQVITGLGIGGSLGALTVMTPFTVEKRDRSVANSAILQFRLMGGAVGLAVVTTVLNNYIQSHLTGVLTPEQLDTFLKTTSLLAELPPSTVDIVRRVYSNGFNAQMRVAIGFAAAQIPAALLMWRRKQIIV